MNWGRKTQRGGRNRFHSSPLFVHSSAFWRQTPIKSIRCKWAGRQTRCHGVACNTIRAAFGSCSVHLTCFSAFSLADGAQLYLPPLETAPGRIRKLWNELEHYAILLFCLSLIICEALLNEAGGWSYCNRLSRTRALHSKRNMWYIFFNKCDQSHAGELVMWERIMTYSRLFPAGCVLFYKVICAKSSRGKWAFLRRVSV